MLAVTRCRSRPQHPELEPKAYESIRKKLAEAGNQQSPEVPNRFFRDAKALNRSVIGSMNDLAKMASFYLVEGNLSLIEISSRLKDTPMTGLKHAGSTHGYPRDVFADMVYGDR